MDKSQDNYTKWKKSYKEEHMFMFPFKKIYRKCKLMYSDRKEISGCLEPVLEREMDY